MQSDASTSPRRRSTSCYSDSGDSSCSEPFSECGSDDLSFTPAAAAGIHRLLLSCVVEASEDAISSLMAELESPAPSLDSLRRAAMELRLLAKHNPDNRVRIAKAGGVRPLVKLLSHADPLLQEHGVTALLNLSLCDENKATIVEAGAIRPLVQALKSAASPAARENAACALLRLAELRQCGRYLTSWPTRSPAWWTRLPACSTPSWASARAAPPPSWSAASPSSSRWWMAVD